MEANKWEKWEKTRAKGTLHYVLSYGFLFGIPVGFFVMFGNYLFSFFYPSNSSIFQFNNLFVHLGFSLIFGFIYGIVDWFFSETAYQRSRKNKDFNIWIPKQKDISKISE